MGKRSGIPHREEELAVASDAQVHAYLADARTRLTWAPSAKMRKLFEKQVHWLEAELRRREDEE